MNSNKRILVTGGTGFLGFALVKRLIASGHLVRIITRGFQTDPVFEQFLSEIPETSLEIFTGNIQEYSSIEPAFEKVSYVFHAAALLNSVLPYNKFEAANFTATKNICELSLKHRVNKLIYISTCDVFGLPGKNKILTEISPYRKWSEPYADTKIMASQLVKDYQKKGLESTIFYPGWVYGPGDKAFMPSILAQLQSGILPIWDGGKYNLCLVYIDDLVDALMSALMNEKTTNEDFLILDDDSRTTTEDVGNILGRLFDIKFRTIRLPYWIVFLIAWFSMKLCQLGLFSKPIMSTTDVKSLGKNFRYSTNKAKSMLGWSVTRDFRSGIQEWKLWYDDL